MPDIKALVCVIKKVYMYKQFVRMYARNLIMYQQRPTTCKYICNMFISMNELVMYVGVSNNVYTRICICKHEQDGAHVSMISIYVYAYVSMYINVCICMYEQRISIYLHCQCIC